jgi:hypothetical protein
MFLLQDWTAIAGSGTNAFVQSVLDWADFGRHADAVFWLEVRAVGNPGAGSVTLSYETSPVRDGTVFRPIAALTFTASTAPVVTKVRIADNPAVPLARWVRWKLEGTAAGDWSVTFRIFALGGHASTGFAPSSLALTGWWRASYSGSPWSGIASAGSSGGRDVSEATNPPAAGGAVNGYTPADFDGTNDFLASTASYADFFSGSAFTVVVLVNVDTAPAPSVNPHDNATIVADSTGHWGVGVNTSGLRAFIFDGTTKDTASDAYVTVSTGTWTMLKVKWTGTQLQIGKNGDAFTTGVASGDLAAKAGVLRLGRSWDVQYFDGKVLEVLVAPSALSADELENLRAYFNARYALSL